MENRRAINSYGRIRAWRNDSRNFLRRGRTPPYLRSSLRTDVCVVVLTLYVVTRNATKFQPINSSPLPLIRSNWVAEIPGVLHDRDSSCHQKPSTASYWEFAGRGEGRRRRLQWGRRTSLLVDLSYVAVEMKGVQDWFLRHFHFLVFFLALRVRQNTERADYSRVSRKPWRQTRWTLVPTSGANWTAFLV